eukprot:3784788-Pleurochrysis_carterae.AAC.1
MELGQRASEGSSGDGSCVDGRNGHGLGTGIEEASSRSSPCGAASQHPLQDQDVEAGAAGSSAQTPQEGATKRSLRKRKKVRRQGMATFGENELRVARIFWFAGFALLPWLWAIAWVHFRKDACVAHAPRELGIYVRRCRIATLCACVAFVCWVVTFQLSWRSWGELGRSLLLFTPAEPAEL